MEAVADLALCEDEAKQGMALRSIHTPVFFCFPAPTLSPALLIPSPIFSQQVGS